MPSALEPWHSAATSPPLPHRPRDGLHRRVLREVEGRPAAAGEDDDVVPAGVADDVGELRRRRQQRGPRRIGEEVAAQLEILRHPRGVPRIRLRVHRRRAALDARHVHGDAGGQEFHNWNNGLLRHEARGSLRRRERGGAREHDERPP